VIWSSWTLESLLLATMAKLSLPRVNAAMPRAPDKEVKLPWPSVALSTDSGLSGSVTSSSSTPLSYLLATTAKVIPGSVLFTKVATPLAPYNMVDSSSVALPKADGCSGSVTFSTCTLSSCWPTTIA
jgi:hypothetical protein